MTKTVHYALICVIAIICNNACQRNIDSQEDIKNISSKNVIPINIDKTLYTDKYSNLFSEIKYVSLEETTNSIIGEVSKLEITKDGEFIVFDALARAVFRFTANGKFLNNIGFRGSGEKEYILPIDMKYDPFTNRVLVWDNGKRSILTYKLNGEMEKRIQLPWIIGTFGVIDQDYLICYMNNSEDIRGGEKGYNYKVIKRDGTIEKEFGEYGVEKANFRPNAVHTFNFQLGKCLCNPPFSPTLYDVKGDSLNAVVTFDLLENTIPPEWLCGHYADFCEKIIEYPNFTKINSVYETTRYYILNLLKNGTSLLCFINKDNKEIKSMSSILINDLFGMVEHNHLTYAQNNKLYFAIDPMMFGHKWALIKRTAEYSNLKKAYLKEEESICSYLDKIFGENSATIYIDSLKTTNFKLIPGERELIEEMSNKNNPIIQICTLK